MARPTIKISNGLIQGVESKFSENITVYKGIPYAASTAGENRWRPPQPSRSWEGTHAADSFGPPCPQMSPQLQTLCSMYRKKDFKLVDLDVWYTASERPASQNRVDQ